MNSRELQSVVISCMAAVVLVGVLFCLSLLPVGQRQTTSVETITGIAYPTQQGKISVTEDLAHFDIELQEPALAKQALITFEYNPQQVRTLDLGIRENSFWLSYERQRFYVATTPTINGWRKASVTIPLSNKLQDTDRSVDTMFFANATDDLVQLAANRQETTQWQLRNLQVQVMYAAPSLSDLKHYVKSVLTRERPL